MSDALTKYCADLIYRLDKGPFTRPANDQVVYLASEVDAALARLPVTGATSDGYHTFDELYDYRKAFNALLFSQWAALGVFDVHKAWKHSDGEPCFGGGWFIVVAQTPAGQISNHYKTEDWELFSIPERERSAEYDGHTPQIALQRMMQLAIAAAVAPRAQPDADSACCSPSSVPLSDGNAPTSSSSDVSASPRPAGGWQPTKEQQETIDEMRLASDLSDEAIGTSEYTARMYALALIARELLRRIPSPARAQGASS